MSEEIKPGPGVHEVAAIGLGMELVPRFQLESAQVRIKELEAWNKAQMGDKRITDEVGYWCRKYGALNLAQVIRGAMDWAQSDDKARISELEAHNTDMDCQAVVFAERRAKQSEKSLAECNKQNLAYEANYLMERDKAESAEESLSAREKELKTAVERLGPVERGRQQFLEELRRCQSSLAAREAENSALQAEVRGLREAIGVFFHHWEHGGISKDNQFHQQTAWVLRNALSRPASSYASEAEAVEKVIEAAKEIDMRIVHTNEVEQALRDALAGLERARKGEK